MLKVKPIVIATFASLLVHSGLLLVLARGDGLLAYGRSQSSPARAVHSLSVSLLTAAGERSTATLSDDSGPTSNALRSQSQVGQSGPEQFESMTTDYPLGYYRSSQLTKHATPLRSIELDLPQGNPEPDSGVVVLNLWINALGIVVKSEIEHSDFSASYSDAVAAAFSQETYAPGEIEGMPVNSIYRVEIESDMITPSIATVPRQ